MVIDQPSDRGDAMKKKKQISADCTDWQIMASLTKQTSKGKSQLTATVFLPIVVIAAIVIYIIS